MSHLQRLRRAFAVFHFTLAAVLVVQSLALMCQTANIHLRALAIIEALAAILFAVPGTMRIGGGILVAVFTLGAGFHMAHGELPGALLVYAAGTVFVLLHGTRGRRYAATAIEKRGRFTSR